MRVIDLTRPFSRERDFPWEVRTTLLPLSSDRTAYTGVIHELKCSSMCGSYLDVPGHIRETDDGTDAANCPPERFWRLEARVAHLKRLQSPGAVTADELAAAFGTAPGAPCLVVHALEEKDIWEMGGEGEEVWRQTWLDASAVDWIVASGCRLLVSDIYESPRLEGVFLRLFAAGISTVCMPKGLARLGGAARISVTFLPVEGMVQMPCRIIAEEE